MGTNNPSRNSNAGNNRIVTRNDPTSPPSARSVASPEATVIASENAGVASGPHARPVVVMLGLFACCGCQISAVMLEGDTYIWLDLITRGGSRTSPLATVADVATSEPRVEVEAAHLYWAGRPEIRWHLARQTANLYRAHLGNKNPPSGSHPRPSAQPSNCPEPRHRTTADADARTGEIVWRAGE